MFHTLEVVTPADETDLTLVDTVKQDLGITSGAEDDYLTELIKRVSSQVCAYLKVPQADDGSRTLAAEELRETFRFAGGHRRRLCGDGDNLRHSRLILSRKPVTAISSVIENGVTLDADDYQIIGRSGILVRLSNDRERDWNTGAKIVVVYTAGWLLADEGDDATLPDEIEGAAIDIIKGARAARKRDPLVKAKQVQDIDQVEYWVGGIPGQGTLPPDIAAKLDPYKYRTLG